jgi:hypothetical protein
MLRNRPAATLIAILVLAGWPTSALAAGPATSRLTRTPPSWLTTQVSAGQRPPAAPALPRTGSDLVLEGLIAAGLIAAGAAVRLGLPRGRA